MKDIFLAFHLLLKFCRRQLLILTHFYDFTAGITKNKQEETIKLFTKGDYKVIVATTIAEEGLDIKACNLVVKYDYAGNLISQIQAKGAYDSDFNT